MKRNINFTLIILMLSWCCISCHCRNKSTTTDNDKNSIQTGDLLFVELPYTYCLNDHSADSILLKQLTGREDINYIHVAILEKDENDSIWVIDATLAKGVDRHPYSQFLKAFTLNDGSYPNMKIMRLKNAENAAKYVENAKQFCGTAYDCSFLIDNDSLYCSELVYRAYVNDKGESLFQLCPINFMTEDSLMPPYWDDLFMLIDKKIPQGNTGILPSDLMKDDQLEMANVKLQ